MKRVSLLVIGVMLLAFPGAAVAQLPQAGPLVPPQMLNPPERVPAPPVGEYPEHWAECVEKTDPLPPVLPAGIDPRGVDPGQPNPLLGLNWFVDRMEPAYQTWSRWMRS